MTKDEKQLIDALEQLAREAAPGVPSFLAKVNSVNETDYICNVTLSNGSVIDDARLRAVINNSAAMAMTPVVGTFVLIARIERTSEWIVIAYDQVDKVIWNMKDAKLNADAFSFNNGQNGGLIKITKLVEKINAIENKCNLLEAVLASHTHPVAGTLASASTPLIVPQPITLTLKPELENTKVKH